MIGVSLTLYFDEEQYRDIYTEATDEQLIRIFKEDFLDTIRKQFSDEDILNALEVEQ
jgi:hypothetical protein